jgi:hypothetical protein
MVLFFKVLLLKKPNPKSKAIRNTWCWTRQLHALDVRGGLEGYSTV